MSLLQQILDICDLPLGKAGVIMCEFPQIQKQNSKVTGHKFNSCLPESACLKMSVLYLFQILETMFH